ncbi:MAG: retroviral-like aspartic protease family protein [Bacteroidales bacterium]
MITKNVIDRLGLVATGIETVFHAGGQSVVGTYLVNILLPNNIGIHSLRVSEGLLKGVDVFIGMDIIALGDFTICLHDGKTKFSFQLPSTHDFDMTRKE